MFRKLWKRFFEEEYVTNVKNAEKEGWSYLPLLYESDSMLGALKPKVNMQTIYKEGNDI